MSVEQELARLVVTTSPSPPQPAAYDNTALAFVPELCAFKYHVRNVEEIGAGNQGVIYSAIRTKTGLKVAIKRIPLSGRPKLKPDVSRDEISTLVALKGHANVLHILYACKTAHARILVTEYCPDGDLLTHMHDHGNYLLQEDDARRLFGPVVSAVEYAHSRGYIHRDLKLENIYLSQGCVKVGDWGMATKWHPTKRLCDSYGSEHYSSPEILLGTTYIGPEVDIWSLGVILYAMMHGRLPFNFSANEPRETSIARAVAADTKIHADCSINVSRLIRKLLSPEALNRPAARQILGDEWLKTSSSYRSQEALLLQQDEV